MSNYPILKNAPITEALIDIHVKVPDDYDVVQLKSLYNVDKYPDQKEWKKWEGRIEFKKGSPPYF